SPTSLPPPSFPTRRSSDLTFFVGVPRIYEKLQQGFLFRLGESGRLRQGFTRACLAWGRTLSDRRQAGKANLLDRAAFGLLYMLRSEEHTSELQSRENLVCR